MISSHWPRLTLYAFRAVLAVGSRVQSVQLHYNPGLSLLDLFTYSVISPPLLPVYYSLPTFTFLLRCCGPYYYVSQNFASFTLSYLYCDALSLAQIHTDSSQNPRPEKVNHRVIEPLPTCALIFQNRRASKFMVCSEEKTFDGTYNHRSSDTMQLAAGSFNIGYLQQANVSMMNVEFWQFVNVYGLKNVSLNAIFFLKQKKGCCCTEQEAFELENSSTSVTRQLCFW